MKHIKKNIQARVADPKMNSTKPEKKQKTLKDMKLEDIPGLQQVVKGKKLYQIITREDAWQHQRGKNMLTIIRHVGVQKIADFSKVSKDVEYKILTQPDAYNNYQYTISAKVCFLGKKDDCATEIGEANRSNLSNRGRNNPANMAEKRAYDRAIFRLLGITGILSEEELADLEEDEESMDELTHAERKHIAPAINKLLLAGSQKDLAEFNKRMKDGEAAKLNDKQRDYVRKLYQKRVGELSKMNF